MELLNKLTEQTNIFFDYFPSEKSRVKIIFGLIILTLNVLLIVDFAIPRENVIAYIYDQEEMEKNMLIRSANTANFIVKIVNHNQKIDFTDRGLFVYRTRIYGRIDPVVMINEDAVFQVIYNTRTSFFFAPILSILFSLLLIYNKFDDEDGVIDAAFVCFIVFATIINLMLNINALLLFRG